MKVDFKLRVGASECACAGVEAPQPSRSSYYLYYININYPQIPAYVVYCVTVAVGAFNHYLLPHIRKEMPWLCCSQPIVRAREWDVFEVTGMYIYRIMYT